MPKPNPHASHRGLRVARGLDGHLARLLLACATLLVALPPVCAQSQAPVGSPTRELAPFQNRLIREVRIEGLGRVSEQLTRNQIRTRAGQPLDTTTLEGDIRRLERLGEFARVRADIAIDPDPVTNPDLAVVVIFQVYEGPIVRDVVVVGNRQVTDQEVRQVVSEVISLLPGIPIDEFQIGRAQQAIENLYREKGYYLVEVSVDRTELQDAGVIVFRVREGERVKITGIRIEGNEAISDRLLRTAIQTRTAGLFNKGAINSQGLEADVTAIIRFYLDRGYLDARAGFQLVPSPNGREAIVRFLVEEGPLYTLRSIEVQHERNPGSPGGPSDPVFDRRQVEGNISLKKGDVYSQRAIREATNEVSRQYRKIGYVDVNVRFVERRDTQRPVIDVSFVINEGRHFKAGMVHVQGNHLTQQKVIRREIDVKPDRRLDGAALEETEFRLARMRLWDTFQNPPKVTIQDEDPAMPGYRDVLVEVEETVTGTLSFGAAVTSDAGVAGRIQLNQRNFDIADVPDSFDELFRGRAFRGGGQIFDLVLSPGTEVAVYSLSLTEPAIFDTDYSLRGTTFFRQREFDEFDEERLGGRFALGRRFGTRWRGSLGLRAENIDISEVDPNSAEDFLETEGTNLLTSMSFSLTRNTLDNQFRATSGTVTDLSVEQVGAMGGDFDYTKIAIGHSVFFPISEDYLGRKTTIKLEGRAGYIIPEDEAPVFERFFLGGRSFRGFDFRGVGPNGVRTDGTETDDKVGDDWMLFFGVQLEQPLWRDLISAVFFVDSGTIAEHPGFDDYRVSVGVGFRLYFPQLGPAPLAFDFGWPIVKEEDDEEQLFSFSVDLPFQ